MIVFYPLGPCYEIMEGEERGRGMYILCQVGVDCKHTDPEINPKYEIDTHTTVDIVCFVLSS